ncbi:hypothetical protein C8R44DRAFT_740841 [Mycena epipterygia]|nr:hypothetical protein C8R44DRAFT_740841 [Mycena epipterygia]
MAEVWSTVNLISDAKAASVALAHLRRVLPAELNENEEVTSALENLESKVSGLLSIIIVHQSMIPLRYSEAFSATQFLSSEPTAPVRNLVGYAHEMLWDQIPLHAMMNTYKLKAAELSKGDNESSRNVKIYALYYTKALWAPPGTSSRTWCQMLDISQDKMLDK